MSENRPRRREAVRAANLESLTTMGMGVTHDFNNLLAAILGNALVIKRSLSEGSRARESVQQIERCALRGLELTNRMLVYTGRAPFTATTTNLSKLIRAMAADLAKLASKDVRVQYDLSEDLPDMQCDTDQVRQLVLELVTNASETLVEQRGHIVISTGAVDCDREYLRLICLGDSLPARRYVYIQVADDGKGIPARNRKRMLDPFFTTKIRGQGLGLCVVLGVLRAHNGALDAWSRAYKGSMFRALFPAG